MMQKQTIAREKMLSVPHLVIIFLVALIVFGPEKLPELARSFGKVMAEFKRATGDLRAGFDEHMRELERETRVNEMRTRQSPLTQQPNTILPPSPAAAPPPSEPVSAAKPSTIEPGFSETASEKPRDGI
ncbi:MAG: twin-arginine translocase TatA/TatE family subunit [Candidatus Acidiferrales bacterium]